MAEKNRKTGTTKREFEAYQIRSRMIKEATASRKMNETEAEKNARKKRLVADPMAFCKYYFQEFIDSDFAWFHKQAFADLLKYNTGRFVWEFPREHAKSMLMDVFVPMYEIARGTLTGVVLASQNEKKAKVLLADLQAQLANNQLFIDDWATQSAMGSWTDGYFVFNGIGFWALGRGQSPRGIRVGANRPNLLILDDVDDDEMVNSQDRVEKAVDWVNSAFWGCAAIKGARMIVGGNRIHQKSILAHLVGDLEEGDKVSEDIHHIKVYAIEDKHHNASYIGAPGARPAWKERYSIEMLQEKWKGMGYFAVQKEYFHNPLKKGNIFKSEYMCWCKLPELQDYLYFVTYCDPSFKEDADCKAVVLLGIVEGAAKGEYFYDIIDGWVRQASVLEMCEAHYRLLLSVDEFAAQHWYEANFSQDSHEKTYKQVAKKHGMTQIVRQDKRKKPDKVGRIEALTPEFEQLVMRFNLAKKDSPDMKTLYNQFLSFPKGKDDGPDAVEGGYYYLKRVSKRSGQKARTGNYTQSHERRFG